MSLVHSGLLRWAATLVPLAIMACAHGAPAKQAPVEAGAQTEDAATAGRTGAESPGRVSPEQSLPPDGRWLVDDEGREYFVDKLPKGVGAGYKRLEGPGNRLQTPWGIIVEEVGEDEQFHYYKVYRTDAIERPRLREEEDYEQVALGYRAELAASETMTFAPFDQGLPRSGQWRQGFEIADLDGDGHLDIVHGPARKSFTAPVVLLGDGKGGWRPWREAVFPRFPYDYGDIAVADFDGDGRLDLALAIHLRGVVALVQKQPGTFELWNQGLDFQAPGKEADYTSRAIEAADWNADGRPDLVTFGEGPRMQLTGGASPSAPLESFGIVVYLNGGDGRWERRDQGTNPSQPFGDGLLVADVDDDGRLDILTTSSRQGSSAVVHLGGADGSWTVEALELRRRSFVRSITAGDFDLDGRTDLALGFMSYEAARWWSGIEIYYRRAEGGFRRRLLLASESRNSFWTLTAGDLDRDGRLDLVALDGEGAVSVFRGQSDGFFAREKVELTKPNPGCRGYQARIVDLDGDGGMELVATFSGEASTGFSPGVGAHEGCPGEGSIRAWKAASKGR